MYSVAIALAIACSANAFCIPSPVQIHKHHILSFRPVVCHYISHGCFCFGRKFECGRFCLNEFIACGQMALGHTNEQRCKYTLLLLARPSRSVSVSPLLHLSLSLYFSAVIYNNNVRSPEASQISFFSRSLYSISESNSTQNSKLQTQKHAHASTNNIKQYYARLRSCSCSCSAPPQNLYICSVLLTVRGDCIVCAAFVHNRSRTIKCYTAPIQRG